MFRKLLEKFRIVSKKPTTNEAHEEALRTVFANKKNDSVITNVSWLDKPFEGEGESSIRVEEEAYLKNFDKVLKACKETKQQGIKLDQGKPSYMLLPFKAITEVVKVLEFGKQKYAKDNWQKVANSRERYLDATFRHLIAYIEGEKVDKESGLHHLAHATCCLLFILWFDLMGKKEDNKIL